MYQIATGQLTSFPSPLAVNKTANIIVKTLQFKTVCKDDGGYITQLK